MKPGYQSTPSGAIIFDADVVETVDEQWFRPEYWQSRRAIDGTQKSGRGTALFVSWDGCEWVLRHYRRGGRIARLIEDQYLWLGEGLTRGFREWRLLGQLREWELSVPHPVAACYRRSGLIYRADILVATISGARSLTARLAAGGLSDTEWQAVGASIGRFHAAGVYHADLNADNVLFDARNRVFIVDFDRGRIRRKNKTWQRANLARLHRSLVKRGRRDSRIEFTDAAWRELLEGYANAQSDG